MFHQPQPTLGSHERSNSLFLSRAKKLTLPPLERWLRSIPLHIILLSTDRFSIIVFTLPSNDGTKRKWTVISRNSTKLIETREETATENILSGRRGGRLDRRKVMDGRWKQKRVNCWPLYVRLGDTLGPRKSMHPHATLSLDAGEGVGDVRLLHYVFLSPLTLILFHLLACLPCFVRFFSANLAVPLFPSHVLSSPPLPPSLFPLITQRISSN